MPAEPQLDPPTVPDMPLWELQAMSQVDDLILAFRNQQGWWWRITATGEPWPVFPGPQWTPLAEPLKRGVQEGYLLVRGKADPSLSAHMAYTKLDG